MVCVFLDTCRQQLFGSCCVTIHKVLFHIHFVQMTVASLNIAMCVFVCCACSWQQYFAAGALFGFPLSIHKKSYWPFTLAAVAGSAVDIMEVSRLFFGGVGLLQLMCYPQLRWSKFHLRRGGVMISMALLNGVPDVS